MASQTEAPEGAPDAERQAEEVTAQAQTELEAVRKEVATDDETAQALPELVTAPAESDAGQASPAESLPGAALLDDVPEPVAAPMEPNLELMAALLEDAAGPENAPPVVAPPVAAPPEAQSDVAASSPDSFDERRAQRASTMIQSRYRGRKVREQVKSGLISIGKGTLKAFGLHKAYAGSDDAAAVEDALTAAQSGASDLAELADASSEVPGSTSADAVSAGAGSPVHAGVSLMSSATSASRAGLGVGPTPEEQQTPVKSEKSDQLQKIEAQRKELQDRRRQVLQRHEELIAQTQPQLEEIEAQVRQLDAEQSEITGVAVESSTVITEGTALLHGSQQRIKSADRQRASLTGDNRLRKGSRRYSKPGSSSERYRQTTSPGPDDKKTEEETDAAAKENIKSSQRPKPKNFSMHVAAQGALHARISQLAATLRYSKDNVQRLRTSAAENSRELEDLHAERDVWRAESERLDRMAQAVKAEAEPEQRRSPVNPRRTAPRTTVIAQTLQRR